MVFWRVCLCWCLVLGLAGVLYASGGLEVLEQRMQKAEGLEKVQLLNELASKYRSEQADKSLFYARQAIRQAEKLDEELAGRDYWLAQSHLNAGAVLRNIGKMDEALKDFLFALQKAEKLQNDTLQADALHKISVSYLFARDFANALEYATQESRILDRMASPDSTDLADAHNLLGLIYLNLKQFDTSLEHLQRSLDIATRLPDPTQRYKPLVNLGDLFIRKKEPAKALPYLEWSRDVCITTQNRPGLASALLKLGEAYAALGQYDKALPLMDSALVTARQIRSLPLKRNAYLRLSETYNLAGNYQSALEYTKLYISSEDSMVNELTKRKIAEMETRYKADQQQQEIESLTSEAYYARLLTLALVVLLALAGLALYAFYQRFQAQRKANEEITLRNARIQQQSDEIQQQHHEIAAQADTLQRQQAEVLHKTLIIEQSVRHARALQMRLTNTNPHIFNLFGDRFIWEKPLDEVAGCFYWASQYQDSILLAVVDCRQTGVPGALQSVVAGSLLGQVIGEGLYPTPADMLSEWHSRLLGIKALDEAHQIEVVLCSIHTTNYRILMASAGLPLTLMRNGTVTTLAGHPKPIGTQTLHIQNKSVSLSRGDKIILANNGVLTTSNHQQQVFGDQIGNLLKQTENRNLWETQETLCQQLQRWSGLGQTADWLMIGVEV